LGQTVVQSVQNLVASDPAILAVVNRLDELNFATASPQQLQAVVDDLLKALTAKFPGLDIQAASVLLVTVNPDGTLSQVVPAQILVKDPVTGQIAILTIGSGYLPGSTVTLTVESEPIMLGEVEVTDGGKFMAIAELPASLPSGKHTLKASGTDPQGNERVLGQPIEVQAAPVEPAKSKDRTELAAPADFSPPSNKSGGSSFPLILGLGVAGLAAAGAFLLRRKPAKQS